MALRIADPEIFGVTDDSLTLFFRVVEDEAPVDAEARVRVNGELRGTSRGDGACRQLRLQGLEPDSELRVDLEVTGAEAPERDAYFPERVRTLPRPTAASVARLATLNDVHFGEPRFGGILLDDGEYGDEAPGFPVIHESDTEVPYWKLMNDDAVAEINAAGVDLTVVKGDIADRGRPEQFEAAAKCFARLEAPHAAFLGNHDHYALLEGQRVDGYALLGQPPAPRVVELGGWRLVLLDSVEPGEHHGVFPEERRRWLTEILEAGRDEARPTLLFMHHQPVPPAFRDRYPNSIGLLPEHSTPLLERIGAHPEVRGVLIGHTHRNRVRLHPASGETPFVEVQCSKDYPGGWAHYTLYEDGSFRQEARRTATPRALRHSTRCREAFRGFYRDFSLGRLEQRSFHVPAEPRRGIR